MDLKTRAKERIEKDSAALIDISHKIHDRPELAYQEVSAAGWLADELESGGMKVERSAHGLETAFRATAGESGRHFVICAEYDALPEIGHACGHNIIGTSAVGAGLALSELATDLGIRVTVLGTPAEESGGGKVELIKAGAFDDADLALMVHPGPVDVVDWPTLAWTGLNIRFHGKESHASAFPERGLNALDAMNLSYFAIAALRQHISRDERIHGIVTHGGDAANIVPKLTEGRFFVRAASLQELIPLKARVMKCFEAGALATGCEVEFISLDNDYDFVRTNLALGAVYEQNLQPLGRGALPRSMVEKFAGSTDMGNVSHIVPSIHPLMGIDSLPAVNHQAEFTAATITPAGDKAVTDGAIAMAWTVIDLATDETTMAKVREEFENPAPPANASSLFL